MLLTTVPEALKAKVEATVSDETAIVRVLDACLDYRLASGPILKALQQIKSDAGRGETPSSSDDIELYLAYRQLAKASLRYSKPVRNAAEDSLSHWRNALSLFRARQCVACLLVERGIALTGKYKRAYEEQSYTRNQNEAWTTYGCTTSA